MIGSLILTMFLFRHEHWNIGAWISTAIMMFVIALPFAVPAIGNLITAKPRVTFWVGIAVAIGSLAALFALIFSSAFYNFPKGVNGADPLSYTMMYGLMVGIGLTVLPRGMLAQKRLEPLLVKPRSQLPRGKPVGGALEAADAILSTAYRIVPFFRLAGFWILAIWATPLIGLWIASSLTGDSISMLTTSTDKNIVGLKIIASRLLFWPVSMVAFSTILVTWHRYLLENYQPRFVIPLPSWRAVRYLFGLWITICLFGVLALVAFSNGPDLARLIGAKDGLLVSELAFLAALLLAIYIGSSYALVLPAIAVGDRQFGAMDALVMTRSSAMRYRIGFMVSLLPVALAYLSTYAVLDAFWNQGDWTTRYALGAIPLTLFILGLAICATYLSRVYEEAKRAPSAAPA